jgi:hypothetical protein
MNFSRLVVIVDLAGREARRRMRHFGGSTPAAKHSNILRTADMKLIRKKALLTLGLVLGIAAPAAAQQTGRDARCLLVSSIFSTSANDEKARQAADTTRAFFLGRLDGRLSPSQIASAFAAERANLTQASLASAMNACAKYVSSQTINVQNSIKGVKRR